MLSHALRGMVNMLGHGEEPVPMVNMLGLWLTGRPAGGRPRAPSD